MVQGWVTTLVLVFGIIVAIFGVIAYLRMFRKDRLSSTIQSTAVVSPPNPTIAANSMDSGHGNEAISEQAAPRD